jgi:hypothetical protein
MWTRIARLCELCQKNPAQNFEYGKPAMCQECAVKEHEKYMQDRGWKELPAPQQHLKTPQGWKSSKIFIGSYSEGYQEAIGWLNKNWNSQYDLYEEMFTDDFRFHLVPKGTSLIEAEKNLGTILEGGASTFNEKSDFIQALKESIEDLGDTEE